MQNFEEKSIEKLQRVKRVSSNPWCQAAVISCKPAPFASTSTPLHAAISF